MFNLNENRDTATITTQTTTATTTSATTALSSTTNITNTTAITATTNSNELFSVTPVTDNDDNDDNDYDFLITSHLDDDIIHDNFLLNAHPLAEITQRQYGNVVHLNSTGGLANNVVLLFSRNGSNSSSSPPPPTSSSSSSSPPFSQNGRGCFDSCNKYACTSHHDKYRQTIEDTDLGRKINIETGMDLTYNDKKSMATTMKTPNIFKILQHRETALKGFNLPQKKLMNNHYKPNHMIKRLHYSHKQFVGVYSKEGDYFINGSQDGVLRLYDTSRGQLKHLRSIQGSRVGWSVLDIALSPDGQMALYSSWSDYLHMFRVRNNESPQSHHKKSSNNHHHNRQQQQQRRRRRRLRRLYHNEEDEEEEDEEEEEEEDEEIVTTSRQEPIVMNWERDGNFCLFSVSFSNDGKQILGGSNVGYVCLYDLESESGSMKISAHDDDVNSVTYIDESSFLLASAGDDGMCKVWDTRELSEMSSKPVGVLAGHLDGITFVDSKGDSRYLLTNSKDQSLKLWDMRKFSTSSAVKEAKKRVRMQEWDYRWHSIEARANNPAKLSRLKNDSSVMTYSGHTVASTLIRARFSPGFTTGQRFAYCGCAKGAIYVYDLVTGKIDERLQGHTGCTRDVHWHPYYNVLLSSSWDKTLGYWVHRSRSDGEDCD